MSEDIQFDVAVIGGGPAGVMAAIRAAQKGARVVLIDKNEQIGRKLMITGNGRCNITQAEFDLPELVAKFGSKGKFLFSAFNLFGPSQLMDFLEGENLKLKVENSGRVFPSSNKSLDVIEVLKKILRDNGITTLMKNAVRDVEIKNSRIERLILKKGAIVAENYILATGGKSYPVTGSDGSGYSLAQKMGHKIVDPRPALTPLEIKNFPLEKSQAISLRGVELNVYQNGKKKFSQSGDLIFTHFGISGPAVLNVSREVGVLLKNGPVEIGLDSKPQLTREKLDEILQKELEKNSAKKIANLSFDFFSPKFWDLILDLAKIDSQINNSRISRKDRHVLIELFKDMRLEVAGLSGFERAMVTAGGIDLKEVDSRNMRSKIVSNLFLVGEVLDLDGPTGGYNLQMCWSSGYLAGENAAEKVLD